MNITNRFNIEEANIKDLKKLSSADLLWCYNLTLLLYKSNCER